MSETETKIVADAGDARRETAMQLATELLAFDIKARAAGSSVLDLLAVLARTTYGLDLRPTAEEIEAAGEPQNAEDGADAAKEPAAV